MVGKLLFLLKWVVIPAALGAGGYYFLGPQIGARIGPPKLSASATTPEPLPDNSEASPDATQYPAPTVDVDSRPMAASTASPDAPKPKHHRRHRTPKAPPSSGPVPPPGDNPPAQDTPPPPDQPPPN